MWITQWQKLSCTQLRREDEVRAVEDDATEYCQRHKLKWDRPREFEAEKEGNAKSLEKRMCLRKLL
jgi:hypothetical protein